ncbi:MAG: pseudouridine synthase [Halothiobacillus sp.]|nr:pseudouridine synthase [Halothiobacillus sp.]
MSKERLQKILATLGFGSRRTIEGWISAGEIKLNGETAQLGTVAVPGDVIDLRGQKITVPTEGLVRRVVIYHKPEGEITSASDPEGRPTVFGSLPSIRQGRWITVGRLDFNTSGLLLVTNDGELANRLMHPSNQIERTYAVRVLGGLSEEQIKQLTTEVQLDDGPASFEQLAEAGGTGANKWYHVTIREGRNREIRRMIEAVEGTVSRLIRISYAGIALPPRLKPGRAQDLPPELEDQLVRLVGLRPETRRKVLDDDAQRRALKPYRARVQESAPKRPIDPERMPHKKPLAPQRPADPELIPYEKPIATKRSAAPARTPHKKPFATKSTPRTRQGTEQNAEGATNTRGTLSRLKPSPRRSEPRAGTPGRKPPRGRS